MMGSRKRATAKAKGETDIPCQYDCGRMSEGNLHIDYTTFHPDEDYRRGFRVSIPCCRECLKGAVRVTLNIPEVASKS